jgi:hypothetical protein
MIAKISYSHTLFNENKSSAFQDIKPCSLLKVYRRFGGKCCLRLQFKRTSQARNKHEALLANCFMLDSCLVCSSTLKMVIFCFKTLINFQ